MCALLPVYGPLGMSLDENRTLLELWPSTNAKAIFQQLSSATRSTSALPTILESSLGGSKRSAECRDFCRWGSSTHVFGVWALGKPHTSTSRQRRWVGLFCANTNRT